MQWLFYPVGIAIGIVVLTPIFLVAVLLVVVGGGLHTVGCTVCDRIIDLAHRGEAWTKKGDAL